MKIFNMFKKKSEPVILIEDKAPLCPLCVLVEEDQNCTYMYLLKYNELKWEPITACWIRNHNKAPVDFDFELIRQTGCAIVMPEDSCAHPRGAPRLKPANIEIVWFEEGEGVALLYEGDILGVIPPWASNDFPPFSRDCIKENSFSMPFIKEENVLWDRVMKAKTFWNGFDEDYWQAFRTERLSILIDRFGEEKKYYAIDGGDFPPKALLRFEKDDTTYLFTLGVSLMPQPKIESSFRNPENYRRIEFCMAIKTEALNKNESEILKRISTVTCLPWYSLSWLGHCHTIAIGNEFSTDLTNLLCVHSDSLQGQEDIAFPDAEGDRTNLYWLVPVSDQEREILIEKGSSEFIDFKKSIKENFYIVE